MRVHGRGGAGGGLSSVTTDGTLTGAGTIASPLGFVPGSGFIGFQPHVSTAFGMTGANQIQLDGIWLPCPWILNSIWVYVGTADAGGLYDLGIYNYAGTRLGHIGAQAFPNTGFRSFAVVGAPITLPAGALLFAWAGNSTTLALAFNGNDGGVAYHNANYAASVGGALPATIAALAGPAPATLAVWCGLS